MIAKGEPAASRIAIIGGGSIGTAWAIVFAAAGHAVTLHDTDTSRHAASHREIGERLADLADAGLLAESPGQVVDRVSYQNSLGDAVSNAAYVQECIAEDLDAKRRLLAELEPLLDDKAIVASSSSFIPASRYAADCAFRSRCLVVHPGNPPYLIKVVEVVPAPFTEPWVTDMVIELMDKAGMSPVLVRREMAGFVFNRLQGALLREAYALVHDGAVSPEEIDLVVRDGLGLRWSLVGPFESVDLNTRGGIAAHAKRMLPSYRRMGAERDEAKDLWTEETIARVIAARRKALPLDEWEHRVVWRDRELMALLAHRKTRNPDKT